MKVAASPRIYILQRSCHHNPEPINLNPEPVFLHFPENILCPAVFDDLDLPAMLRGIRPKAFRQSRNDDALGVEMTAIRDEKAEAGSVLCFMVLEVLSGKGPLPLPWQAQQIHFPRRPEQPRGKW